MLDFLLDAGFKPYIELSQKPKKLLRSRTNILTLAQGGEGIFARPEDIRTFMTALMRHLLDRYGMGEVESWYFELWKREYEAGYFQKEIEGIQEMLVQELQLFEITAAALRQELPQIRLGCGGFSLRHGGENLLKLLDLWKTAKEQPSFLTFYCYAYPADMDTTQKLHSQSMDPQYLRNYLAEVHHLLVQAGYGDLPVHVTEWNSSVSNRNVLHDSCQKGAYVLKNIIDTVGMADVLGYWCASDIFAEYYDTDRFLFGGSGLMTRDGICKPAWYAMEFMNSIAQTFYQKGENYLLTGNAQEDWYIVCHNYKHISFSYTLRQEDEIQVDEISHLLSDSAGLRLKFFLPMPVQEGSACVKTYAVNTAHGSIQDLWAQAGYPQSLHSEDLRYLKSACVPVIRVREYRIQKGRLLFETILEANEIQWIKIQMGQNNV